MQGGAPAPSGGRGEPAGLLHSWTAAEGPGRAGAPDGAAGPAAGGRAAATVHDRRIQSFKKKT